MKATYDIFRRIPQTGPVWIESVQGFENIKARLLHLINFRPGEYFVFDPITRRITPANSLLHVSGPGTIVPFETV
jgi:hypothetical protein